MNRSQTLRKAAILIASLDDRTAEALLAQMGEEQAGRVRRVLAELDDIDPREQADVVEEFRRVGPLMPEKSPPGLELDSALARKLAGTSADPRRVEQSEAEANGSPFRFLHEAQLDALVPALKREHPQTIAVIVSHLPPTRAADVLSRLPSRLQTEVLRRLSDLDETDPEILREVERGLEKWVSDQLRGQRRKMAGLETVAAILSAAGEKTQREILANLAKNDHSLAGRLSSSGHFGAMHLTEAIDLAHSHVPSAAAPDVSPPTIPMAPAAAGWTFKKLVAQDDAVLTAVVRAAGVEMTALAMAGATSQLVHRISGRLSRAEARALQKALANIGPTRLSDVEQAQQELAELGQELDRQGRLPAASGKRLSAVA